MVVLANAVLFSKGIDLLAAPFSLDNADPLGDPVMVIASMGESAFTLTPGGVLVYDPRLGGDERTFVWVDPSGKEEATGIRPREYTYGRISPDGSRAVFDRRGWDNDLWVWSFGPRTEIRLTSPPTVDS